MKRTLIIILAIIGAGILIMVGLRFLSGPEDTWVKDNRGVWIKHGAPTSTPKEVSQQQKLMIAAEKLYQQAKNANQDLSHGPCLGNADADTVVDIAHNPRESIDNLSENQCQDYLEGKAHHFIELDPNGQIIRIN